MKEYKIAEIGGGIQLQIRNACGQILSEREVFSCCVLDIGKFYRVGSNENLWQIKLKTKQGEEILSGLYEMNLLSSTKKLQKTLLICFDCTDNPHDKQIVWNYLIRKIHFLYESADVHEIPNRPGWFNDTSRWLFWANYEEYTLYTSELIKKFKVREYNGIEYTDTFEEFILKVKNLAEKKTISCLVILRIIALIGRLATEDSLNCGVTIVGDNSKTIAKSYLATMVNMYDLVNMDSDRIGSIREKAKNIQDTPLIFISSEPGNKSTKNRVTEIMSWMESGYIEGIPVTVPYVFCLKKLSKDYPLQEMLVFDTENLGEDEVIVVLDKLQYMIISWIGDSGEFWINSIKRVYKNKCKNQEDHIVALVETIITLLLKMCQEMGVSNEIYLNLKCFLELGMEEIKRQRFAKDCILIDVFQKSVLDLVSEGELLLAERKNAPKQLNPEQIYFDEEYYYITKQCLHFICQQIAIDEKSALFIKQLLVQMNKVKIYRTAGSHNRELDIDFQIRNEDDKKQILSGMAVKRNFWDTMGGISLEERGKIYA